MISSVSPLSLMRRLVRRSSLRSFRSASSLRISAWISRSVLLRVRSGATIANGPAWKVEDDSRSSSITSRVSRRSITTGEDRRRDRDDLTVRDGETSLVSLTSLISVFSTIDSRRPCDDLRREREVLLDLPPGDLSRVSTFNISHSRTDLGTSLGGDDETIRSLIIVSSGGIIMSPGGPSMRYVVRAATS
jgi:hypothetical protein